MQVKVEYINEITDATESRWIEIDLNPLESEITDVIGTQDYKIIELQDFDGLQLPVDFDDIEAYVKAVDAYDADTVAAAVYLFGEGFYSEALENGAYQGKFKSEEDFARDLVDSLGILQDAGTLANYFDYEAFAGDLFIQDYYMSDTGHVFRNC